MEERNRASLGASHRLIEAGIVLETEAVWRLSQWGLGQKEPYAELMSKYRARDFQQADKGNNNIMAMHYPAPSMAEVWRELPEGTRLYRGKSRHYAYMQNDGEGQVDVNPIDALIDLLIWVRKEK